MYRSHRRQRDEGKEAKDGYEYRAGDVHIFEASQGLDVNFKVRVLASLLLCPLCEGFFRDAHTIRECLHTFCKFCIMKSVALGNLACPICRERLPTNPQEGIEFDRITQNIVDKIFPQFQETDNIRKRILYQFCGIEEANGGLSASPATTVKQSIRDSEATTCKEASVERAENDSESWEGTKEFFCNVFNKNYKIGTLQNMAIALMPYDSSVKSLPRPYIRTSAHIHVQHVIRFIANKLGIADWTSIVLTLEDQIVHSSHTMDFIFKSRRLDATKCILLRYRIDPSPMKQLS